MSKQANKLSRNDVVKTFVRWWAATHWNTSSERLQALGVCAALSPALEKLYTDKEDLKKALIRHLMFFNTQLNWGGIIGGATLALEEENACGEGVPEEVIVGFKNGLMGPMAGIGDTIDWLTLSPIVTSLCLPAAQEGSVMACMLALFAFSIPATIVGYYLFNLGYKLGRDSVTTLLSSGIVNRIINGLSILGLFMMGVLSASLVKVSTPLAIVNDVATTEIQPLLDKIVPGLLPLLTVLGVYYYLEKRGNKYMTALIALIVIGLVLGTLGIIK
ncbi:MAG: PTS system mannose/fructose/sorbose family transporter subunit IID [Erysipelotrichaceae bacterium]|nr:PTS system mannose/fructose/sorbose family transporter subunit IID [Erysipelotrichaceae bacterium]